ncbi:protein-L-isoaspartate(D-aspartate) O-methyltransferase [Phyllobacterium salinisoli]|uniref:Protein-L-isoaspartate O-methyltransferase n=1 Tax=Phyllobacterium salinisoli TaxID=1899321 RepID=A0A368K853_9HYPH|nr:protein-L-isoaspartate(D-aspartate) O-methyltransferase [Phyllobacterium salinisoli]RCS24240.1 protein-L-isoaspartate(D-aspartate) O-methyltransferase [Phyllobacterium salinisoli]
MTPKLSEREDFAAFVLRMRGRGLNDPRLFTAIETTPRRGFVNGLWADVAYKNRTIPLDCGEYIEGLDDQARLISSLNIEEGHRVLEIGTGSGFTACVMGRLGGRVTTIERYKTLVELTRQRLQALKIENVVVKHADGRHGPPGGGPFDRIIVWPAFESLPRHFIDLLASNGVMIAPIGPGDGQQTVSRLAKIGSRFEREDLLLVRYQPFVEGVASVL